MRSKFDTAAFQAMKAVEVAVREAAGLSAADLDTKLMRKAFDVETGPLTNKTAEPSERQALSDLFADAIGTYKNPHSHRDVLLSDPAEAAEIDSYRKPARPILRETDAPVIGTDELPDRGLPDLHDTRREPAVQGGYSQLTPKMKNKILGEAAWRSSHPICHRTCRFVWPRAEKGMVVLRPGATLGAARGKTSKNASYFIVSHSRDRRARQRGKSSRPVGALSTRIRECLTLNRTSGCRAAGSRGEKLMRVGGPNGYVLSS